MFYILLYCCRLTKSIHLEENGKDKKTGFAASKTAQLTLRRYYAACFFPAIFHKPFLTVTRKELPV
jgi:hypothetical protein